MIFFFLPSISSLLYTDLQRSTDRNGQCSRLYCFCASMSVISSTAHNVARPSMHLTAATGNQYLDTIFFAHTLALNRNLAFFSMQTPLFPLISPHFGSTNRRVVPRTTSACDSTLRSPAKPRRDRRFTASILNNYSIIKTRQPCHKRKRISKP